MEYSCFWPLMPKMSTKHAWQPALLHLARLEELKAQGRLLTAGPNPLPDNPERVSGSLIVAQFESLDAAQEWAEQDPYVDAGVYAEVLIKPFKAVFK